MTFEKEKMGFPEIKMANKVYLTFVDSLEHLRQQEKIVLLIKDLTPGRKKYDARYVRAILSSEPAGLPDEDVLWIRSRVGVLYAKPWAIKITDEMDEFPDAEWLVSNR